MKYKIAIQGEAASFHYIAALRFFNSDIKIVPCETFRQAFDAVKNQRVDFAVCAIENSLFGSINETYDLLVSSKLSIVGEVYLRIKQCLIGLPNSSLDNIKEVYSHPVALAQCEEFLDKNLPDTKKLEHYDTAASVALIKELNEPSIAAIASQEAAKLFGMKVLVKEIETNKQNYTRFVVIQRGKSKSKNVNKTSLIIRTNHKPGALHKALGVFAERSINLSKLQSRPILGKAWHYIFYIDVEAGINSKSLTEALAELKKQGCEVKILGSYKHGVY